MGGSLGSALSHFGAQTENVLTLGGVQAANNAKNAANAAQQQAAQESATLANQMLLAPQPIQADNYQATRTSQLNALRMGMVATMRPGSGGAPTTSAPQLKNTFGA